MLMRMDKKGSLTFSVNQDLFPSSQKNRPADFKEQWLEKWSMLVDVIYSITLDQLIQFYPDVKQAQ